MPPLLKKVFTLNRNDKIVLGTSLCVLILSSIWLYYDLNRGSGSGSGKPIGVLRIKENVAQRKFDQQVVWENLKNEIPLYNNDSIRTGDLSAATIVLNDKTEIALSENSMIVLSVDEDSTNIDFVSGSIDAKRSGKEGEDSGPELTIKSKDKIIKIDDSDISLNKGDTEELVVDVKRGKASIQTADGKKQDLKENERAELTKEGKVEVKKITLIPQSPASGASIFTKKAREPVTLSWKPLEGNRRVRVEVSKRRIFLRPVYRREIAGNSATASLSPGVYYWRISAVNPQSKKREFSETNKFSIIQNSPLRLHSPAQNQSYSYVDDPPFISFAWSKNELATGYRLEIAKDPGFSSLAQSKTTTTTGISLSLPAGKYYWRVKSSSSLAGAGTTSPSQSFVVTKLKKIAPPSPVQPVNGKNIPRIYFEKAGVTFSWKASNEIRKSSLQIAKNASFGSIVFSRDSRGSFTRVRRKLPPGSYYWRVIGSDAKGRKTEPSPAFRFTVGETESVVLLSPASGEKIDAASAKADGISFRWKRNSMPGDYRIEISKNRLFRGQVIRDTVTGLSYQTRGLKKGRWFWRVSLMDGKVALSTSEARSLEISDAFLPPVVVVPPEGAVIDVTNRNSINFSWKKTNGAVYYLVAIEYNNKKLYTARVRGTNWSVSDFSRLDRGKFDFVIKGCRGPLKCTAERRQGFRITLKEPVAPQIDDDSEEFIIEDE